MPLPTTRHPSIFVLIPEPYRKWKGLPRGREFLLCFEDRETKKTPILIDWGFLVRRSRPNGLTSDTGKHAFLVTIPKGRSANPTPKKVQSYPPPSPCRFLRQYLRKTIFNFDHFSAFPYQFPFRWNFLKIGSGILREGNKKSPNLD